MAFGGSGDDIQIRVTLDETGARQQSQKLKTDIESSLKGLSNAAANPTAALKDLTKTFVDASPKAAAAASQLEGVGAKLAKIAPYAIAATAAVAGLTLGFKALINVAADGDKFGDIADAFEENARKAGVLADELQGNLSKAFLDTVDSATLMASANRAFALGIDPKVFDDLASAAKRYADATGGDATQALNELISGVNSGREALLRKFGVVKDGVLILDAFTQKTYDAGQANSNVTDVYEQFTATLRNTYNEVARAINESEALKLVTQAVAAVIGGLAKIVGGAITAFIDFTNQAIRVVRAELENLYNGFLVLGEIIGQIKGGEMPSLSKASAAVAKQLAETAKQGEKADKVMVKLGKSTGGAASAATNFKKQIADALQQSDVGLNDQFGLESFVIPGTADSLRDKLKTALKQINPNDIVASLRDVRTAFLDGIAGTPEQIAEETKKRLAIFEKEVQTANKQLGEGVTTVGPRASGDGTGDKTPSIFGFDAENFSQDAAQAVEGALGSALQAAVQGLQSGEGKAALDSMVSTIGTAVGAAIGGAFGGTGGAAAGGALGGQFAKFTVVGQVASLIADAFSSSNAGDVARRSVDAFFIDLFDENRLSVIINGKLQRVKDLVFEGGTLFGGDVNFTDGSAFNFLNTLPAQAQGAFSAVGTAFEELLGVSDDISGQIGAALANNIGGNLENLQVLIQATGKSFEELEDAIFNAFYDGTITIEQLYNSLVGLQDVMNVGIPGAVGAVDQAFSNLQASLSDGRGSRQLLDSLRDIGAEAIELGIRDFPTLANALVSQFGFATNQVAAFFAAMKAIGITNIQQLVDASREQLATIAASIQSITQGGQAISAVPTAPEATVNQAGNIVRAPPVSSGGGGGGGGRSGKSDAERKAEERKRKLEQEFQAIYKLLTVSAQYDKILKGINDTEASRAAASEKISELYKSIAKASKDVTAAQEQYQKALKKGNEEELARLAKKLEEAQKKLDKMTESSKEANKALQFDLSKVTPLIHSLDHLGVIAKAVGVDLQTNVDILVQGFLKGKLSIYEVTTAIEKQKDVLGQGIPGAIGAVSTAFDNLLKGGRKGGLFSVDSFKDVFVEAEERFKRAGSGGRQKQLADLTDQFNKARDAVQNGINSGKSVKEVEELQAQFDGAKKRLEDFKAVIPKVGFEDLRGFLEENFSEDQVNVFFQALENSGITTFDEFKNASNETVVGILGDLDSLGLAFSDTVDPAVQGIITGLNDAATAATNGKDVLQAAVDVVLKFNEGAAGLPPVFIEGGKALDGWVTALDGSEVALNSLQTPLASLSEGFDKVFTKLATLTQTDWKGKVLFDVTARGVDSRTEDLMDLLFGDGSGGIDATIDVDGGPGVGGLTTAEKSEFFRLRRAKKKGTLSRADQRRFDELNARRSA